MLSHGHSASHIALPANKLGVHKKMDRERTRTTETKRLKGYSMLYGILLNKKVGRKLASPCCLETVLASVGGW